MEACCLVIWVTWVATVRGDLVISGSPDLLLAHVLKRLAAYAERGSRLDRLGLGTGVGLDLVCVWRGI